MSKSLIKVISFFLTIVIAISCSIPFVLATSPTGQIMQDNIASSIIAACKIAVRAFFQSSNLPGIEFSEETNASGTAVAQSEEAIIDYSHAEDGYFMAAWTGNPNETVKILVYPPESEGRYAYTLKTNGAYETFPFSEGDGVYSVGIYENVDGTMYIAKVKKNIEVSLADENSPFLLPNQQCNFNKMSKAVKTAKQLCKGISSDAEKVNVLYSYVINNIEYDHTKAKELEPNYIPVIDRTLELGSGICSDYSALLGAMLRSQGIPTKIIVGYCGPEERYHEWLRVYTADEGTVDNRLTLDANSWNTLDPTYDSAAVDRNHMVEFLEDDRNYVPEFIY